MEAQRKKGVIVGAGIIGSALAYELSQQGMTDLHVVDPDMEGGLSSTERNAGGVRHLWTKPVNIEMSRLSIQLFEKIRHEIGFQQTGYLWLYGQDKANAAKTVYQGAKAANLSYEMLSPADINKKWPFIDKTEDLACGLFGSRDGLINTNSLKNFYRSKAKEKGVTFHNQTAVVHVEEKDQRAKLRLIEVDGYAAAEKFLLQNQLGEIPSKEWEADFVVLCVGAWSSRLLKPLIADPLVQPIRRQIVVFKNDDFDMSPYGMIVDTSGVYFHPEGGNVLAGLVLKNESPGFRFDIDPDFFEGNVWPALFERSSKFERLKFVTGWGGLYSYTPDISGILGRVPGFKSLYESHSFTGHGVMQSYGAAVAMTELIIKKRFETLDASGLSRERFHKSPPELLHEGLHI